MLIMVSVLVIYVLVICAVDVTLRTLWCHLVPWGSFAFRLDIPLLCLHDPYVYIHGGHIELKKCVTLRC